MNKYMTFVEYDKCIQSAALKSKHRWQLDESNIGQPDWFAFTEHFHHGPKCIICGYSYCMNCEELNSECQNANI